MHLNFTDVVVDSYDNPKVVKVRIKISKTYHNQLGVDILLGTMRKDLCSVAAILSYMLQRGQGPEPTWQAIDKTLLYVKDRKALSQAFRAKFWIGAATTTARQGTEETNIKML